MRGFFYNKNGNSETILDDERSIIARNATETMNDQEYETINEEQNDAPEDDDGDRIRDQREAIQISNLRPDDNKAHTYKKSTVKMKRRCNVEPISISNIVLFSILFGIVGAGKLENLSGNEILKE